MASTPITIGLDDDDDNEELPGLPVFAAPSLEEDSFGDDIEYDFPDDFEDELNDPLEPVQDREDLEMAEAIRLSLIESANAGNRNSSLLHPTASPRMQNWYTVYRNLRKEALLRRVPSSTEEPWPMHD